MKYTEKDLYDFMDSGRQILLTTTDGLQFEGQCWAYCETVSHEEFGFDEPCIEIGSTVILLSEIQTIEYIP